MGGDRHLTARVIRPAYFPWLGGWHQGRLSEAIGKPSSVMGGVLVGAVLCFCSRPGDGWRAPHKRKAWSTYPSGQDAPGSECGGCGAGRPMEGHWGSEGKVLARGGLCLRQLRCHHGRHRPGGSHKGHLFLTVQGASMVGFWGGPSFWLADGRLFSGSCHRGEEILVSSSSQGTNTVLRTPPSHLPLNLITSQRSTS